MERLMDVNQQPPYVEIYSDAPLMCASLVNTRRAMSGSSLPELVQWCHGVHRTIDAVASSLGLYKVKALGDDSLTCLFSISPDMPSRQQAEVMLHAAQQLLATLSQVALPGDGGGQLAVKITIHAGKYAGAVVGHSAWTYDLFGEDVLLLLDMDRANSPNCILVSDAALSLISSGPGRQFAPVCKVACDGGREVQMHALTGQAGSSSGLQQGSLSQQLPAPQWPAAATQRPGLSPHLPSLEDVMMPAMLSQPQQQRLEQPVQQQLDQPIQQHQQQLSAAIAAAQCAAKSTHWQPQRGGTATTSAAATAPPAAASAAAAGAAEEDEEGTSSNAMQPNLSFVNPVLESAYIEFQSQPQAGMDLLFILLTLGVTLFSCWSVISSSSSAGTAGPLDRAQLLLASSGQWLLLPVAAAWLLVSPRSYRRWREALWVAHRLLAALHVTVLVLLGALLQRGALLGAAGGPAGAATAAAAAVVAKGALGLHRGKALALLAEQLGLKVRFRAHMLASTLSCALLLLSTAWFHSSSSGVGGSSGALPVWELLQHVLVGWAAPTALLYLWESEDRLRYLHGLEQQRNKAGERHAAKCKDV